MPTYTWMGGSGADWSVAADWTPGDGPPGGADVAIVPPDNSVSVNSAESILALTIDAGALLDIAAGVQIAIDSGIANNAVIFNAGDLVVGAATVDLLGTGALGLTAADGSAAITALSAGDTLVNNGQTITGAGTIGGDDQLSLANNAGAVVASGGVLTIDVVSLSNAGTLAAETSGTLVIASGSFSDLAGTWLAQDGVIELPTSTGFAGIAGAVTLDGISAEFVSSTDSSAPSLTDSWLAPQTILAGATLAVLNGATFGIDRTPGGTIDVGDTTDFGGLLLPFGNAGLLQLGGGTADLTASISNTGQMLGFGLLIASGATLNNTDGTIEARSGSLTFQGALGGGSLAIDAGATLDLSPGWYGGGGALPTTFTAANGVLQINVTDNGGNVTQVGSLAVSGFAAGDTIEIAGTLVGSGSFPGVTVNNDGTTLDVIASNQTIGAIGFSGGTVNLRFSQDASNDEIIAAVSNALPCFAAGTRIRSPTGDIAVEALRIGDEVVTLAGGARGIVRWLGWRRVNCARHPRPHDVRPVRIQAGAFAESVPYRDVFLSPDHAVWVDGALIPIRYLINGASIAQIERDAVTYWHVELDRHDVILAEGLPAETYLDTGNRAAFANGGEAVTLHPDFARRVWAQRGCTELVLDGPRVAAARRHLLVRAERLGHVAEVDPALQVIADGRALAAFVDGRTWRVRLPSEAGWVRLLSRTWVPAQMRPHEDDHRALGVAIARIRLNGRPIALDDPRLSSGWYPSEPAWRWTGGDAGLALAGVRGLAFDLAMTGQYWLRQQPKSRSVR